MKTCSKCNILKPINEFYKRKNRPSPQPECKTCFYKRTLKREHEAKKRAIAYLGGKCVKCGYDKHPAGFDFHHPNNNKNTDWGSLRGKKWEIQKTELDKCMLLCVLCHRLEHTDLSNW